ncbi:MAG: hypothetical protein WBQ89_10160 [Candidatus Acidiferrum sp.]
MNGYANHSGAKNPAMIEVTGLKNLEDGAVGMVGGFGAVDSLVKMGIEWFSLGVDALRAEANEIIQELLVDQLKALAIAVVFGLAMSGEGMLEPIHDWNELLDDTGRGALAGFAIFFFGAFAEIGKVSLMANQGLTQVFQFGGQFSRFRIVAGAVLSRWFFFRAFLRGQFNFELTVFHECFLYSRRSNSFDLA